jgi:N-acetylglutamate synthase-like GNAT family acetyltransferase
MIASNYQVRRATVDDLVMLRRLWQQTQLPVATLEKRLTEFQVVETTGGQVLGAAGLRIAEKHGEIHSEVFTSPTHAEEVRLRLWERIQTVARNHGLCRLWIADASSLFWLDRGFEPAGSELLAKQPKAFADNGAQAWLVLTLREEGATGGSLDAEFELFRLAQKEERERLERRARLLRWLAGGLACVVLVLVCFALVYVFRHWQTVRGR